MKKMLSNRGQITLEFALLLAGIVAVVAIIGFYYLKSIKSSSASAKSSNIKTTTTADNNVLGQVDKVKEVTANG
ncbi:class III signal peptide domain-containing protein, archaeosortase D/PIP-CTERM system-associated [Methanocaldococcus sp. 28A]